MESTFAQNRADTPLSEMHTPSTVQTLLRSHLVQSHHLHSIGVNPADVMIEPDVTAFEMSDFTRTAELAVVGERSVQAALPRIRKLLHKFDGALFPP